MPIQTKIIAGLLIFLTAAALLIILLFPGEKTTTIVAITALLVTTAKAGYDIYEKERERKKMVDDRREKLIVTARYGMWDTTSPNLGVLIYNAGPSPVRLMSVTCHYISSGSTAEMKIEFTNMKSIPTELVPSKHTAKFRDDDFKVDTKSVLAELPANDVWITIATQEGTTIRVDGKDILSVLNSKPTSQFG